MSRLAPFNPSHASAIELALQLAFLPQHGLQGRPIDVFIDVGAGDGRVCAAALRSAQAAGWDAAQVAEGSDCACVCPCWRSGASDAPGCACGRTHVCSPRSGFRSIGVELDHAVLCRAPAEYLSPSSGSHEYVSTPLLIAGDALRVLPTLLRDWWRDAPADDALVLTHDDSDGCSYPHICPHARVCVYAYLAPSGLASLTHTLTHVLRAGGVLVCNMFTLRLDPLVEATAAADPSCAAAESPAPSPCDRVCVCGWTHTHTHALHKHACWYALADGLRVLVVQLRTAEGLTVTRYAAAPAVSV